MKQYVFEGFKLWQKWKLARRLNRRIKGLSSPVVITLQDKIQRHQYDSMWYGGLVATIRHEDQLILLEANGDVYADLYDRSDPKKRHLEYIKDKNNAGEFGYVMQKYIHTDKELAELIRDEHKGYQLDLSHSNCWEFVSFHDDKMGFADCCLVECEDIWSAIAEAVDYLLMAG